MTSTAQFSDDVILVSSFWTTSWRLNCAADIDLKEQDRKMSMCKGGSLAHKMDGEEQP